MAPPRSKPANKPSSKKPQRPTRREELPATCSLPLDLQQLVLNIFKSSFAQRFESDIQPLLQEIKGHLYNRDFQVAFGQDDYLEAYAARWSPSRALGYLQAFFDLKDHLPFFSRNQDEEAIDVHKIVCLGGGAGAEIVALGGLSNLLSRTGGVSKLDIVGIDIADWKAVVENLYQHLITAPPLSKYASAAVKAANAPLTDPTALNVAFHQCDILNKDFSTLGSLMEGATLITLMFTLNELYSTSLPLTQNFLSNLTTCVPEGTILLVIDSPGSYSAVTLNGAEKKYPMHWLLDHTLLQQGPKGETPAWDKITKDESRWFRLSPELKYPIDLEDMRYQLHLYKRVG